MPTSTLFKWRILSSRQAQEATFIRNIETQLDSSILIPFKVIPKRKYAYFVINIVFVILSIMLLLTNCEVHVLTLIGNLTHDYEPSEYEE